MTTVILSFLFHVRVQYVGETSQSLCCRFNNYRANLKRLGQQHNSFLMGTALTI